MVDGAGVSASQGIPQDNVKPVGSKYHRNQKGGKMAMANGLAPKKGGMIWLQDECLGQVESCGPEEERGWSSLAFQV